MHTIVHADCIVGSTMWHNGKKGEPCVRFPCVGTKGVAGPALSASRVGKQLPMFLGRQVIRQVRPDGRGGWPKDGGPQCPSEEHCRGPPAMSGNSPAPGPQNLFQEEVRRAEVDHCQGMGGKVIDDACCGQHGIIKDRSEEGTSGSVERAIPAPNRDREGESNGSTVN